MISSQTLKKLDIFSITFVVFILFFFSIHITIFAQEATANEEQQVFKTYPFSDPDPVPKVGRIYPYFRFDGYSLTGKNREWKMVVLENPYIKVWVTPEIGGKVWGALEKSTNLPFIYFNEVVKFRDIAMRGPWTSGGIEFNFGAIGHTPTTSTPVDYIIKKNKDGSVDCIVGAIDLPSRTQWRVNIHLPKDKAYFETESSWYNPTPLNHSYYHWMNAAADIGDDLRFHYPGSHHINHGGKAFPWPIDEKNRNISIYKNNNFGSHNSYHVLGQYTEHFGGYWKNADFGYGNWSLYDDKPGKKLWIWALSRQGSIWKDLLTDDNNQYMEFQSGRLLNQADAKSSGTPFKHAYFAPHTFDKWNEIWFPIKGIGGIVNGSPYGSLNVNKTEDILNIGICPLQSIDDDLVVTVDGKPVFSKHLVLKPMEVRLESCKLPFTEGKIVVTVGGNKLRYGSPDNEDFQLNRPLSIEAMDKAFDWTSAEGLFTKGEEQAKQRNYNEALKHFRKCLQKEPFHIRALTRTAELYFRRGEYPTALTHVERALAIDTYDAAANFIYGIVNRESDRAIDARDGFGWAARSMEYRSAAYTEMASLYFREQNLERAELYAHRGLDYNRFNINGYQLLAVIYRQKNDEKKAKKYLEILLNIDPLNHFARFEQYLMEPNKKNMAAFNTLIRNELPHETYLELAMTYNHLGLKKEAADVLNVSPPYPTVYYWLAYLYRETAPEKSRHCLEQALKISPELVFPFRRESIEVFRWAKEKKNHWKSLYYLGLILWNKGRLKEAAELFDQCGSLPDFSPFYITRGNLINQLIKNTESNTDANRVRVLADFKTAVRTAKAQRKQRWQWRARHTLSDFYMETTEYGRALENAGEIYKKFPGNYILAMDYAKALIFNGKYKKSLSVLRRTTILPYEGAREGRHLYRRANVLYAAIQIKKENYQSALRYVADARLWPEHLGVGKPYDTDERMENYLENLCREKLGEPFKAVELNDTDSDLVEKVKEILGKQ